MSHHERDGESVEELGQYGPWVWTTYRAHNELLREKLRKRFDAQEGPWLDQVADVLVEIVNARWEGGRKQEKQLEQLYAKLGEVLEQ